MDCSNCVCLLCCRYAQDKEHREKIHAGEISCYDYYPQPDHALEKAIKAVSEMDVQSGVPQSVYVIEECSELIKELMKKQRGKGSDTFVMLTQYGVSKDYVKAQILYKCNRALERYRKTGEV